MYKKPSPLLSRRGYSFVEVALVMVIVTLIMAGYFTYLNFRETARLRTVISQSSQYLSAIGEFRTKHFALPGDMPNAFGNFTDCGENTLTSDSPQGCNGNGNGFIEWDLSEGVKAWELLAKDGFIAGTYSGDCGSPCDGLVNLNIPASEFASVGFYLDVNDAFNVNWLVVGKETLLPNDPAIAFLSVNDTKAIDEKIDDGLPLLGNVRAMPSAASATACVTPGAPETYNTGTAADACAIGFTF